MAGRQLGGRGQRPSGLDAGGRCQIRTSLLLSLLLARFSSEQSYVGRRKSLLSAFTHHSTSLDPGAYQNLHCNTGHLRLDRRSPGRLSEVRNRAMRDVTTLTGRALSIVRC